MKKKVSFSILGLGRVIEKRVFQMFKKEIKNGFVKTVFDINKKKTKKYEKLFNCKAEKSLEKFLNIKSDFIYIATNLAIILSIYLNVLNIIEM